MKRWSDQDKKAIKVRIIGMFSLKDVYMSFLLFLNEDFDDDLLSDGLEILHCID